MPVTSVCCARSVAGQPASKHVCRQQQYTPALQTAQLRSIAHPCVLSHCRRSLHEAGCSDVDILEKSVESAGSVLVGDVADEIEADLVLVSSEAVHTKQVDANLLAEFVPCPVLLLP